MTLKFLVDQAVPELYRSEVMVQTCNIQKGFGVDIIGDGTIFKVGGQILEVKNGA